MDNISRSVRSRKAILDATLAIISRDGTRRLTLDAIARESRMSKGGLMYQFRTKEAVMTALLNQYEWRFDEFHRAYLAEHGAAHPQPELAAQVATLREGCTTPCSIFLALLGAAAEEPRLLSNTREGIAQNLQKAQEEAGDQELTILHWLAAWGLNLLTLLGLSPFLEEERERLFENLLDDQHFSAAFATASEYGSAT